MKFQSFQIIIEQEDDPGEGYFAYCPQIPGCYSNGSTLEEARQNMREAIGLHLTSLQEHHEPLEFGEARPLYKEELLVGIQN